MRVSSQRFMVSVALGSCLAGFSIHQVSAQESKSAPVAKELVQLLEAAKL